MIGLCFEGETTCNSCGKTLPMNALAETIVCNECLHPNNFTVNDWKDLLEAMFKKAPAFSENEGTPLTIITSKHYKIIYGRQNPKFSDTNTYINLEEIYKCAESGKILNPESNIEYSIRMVPEIFKEACPDVTHILCEDFSQLPGRNKTLEVLDAKSHGELVALNCLSCAGTLQIDGSQRLLKCQFCASEFFIPDETWQKIHPVKTKQRFYFLFDDKQLKFEWEHSLYSFVTDADGTIYMSVEPDFGSNEKLWILAINPDFTIKWKQNDLNFNTKTMGGEAKIGLTANSEIMVWSSDRNTMLLLSAADGSEIKRIGKKCEDSEKQTFTIMDFNKCRQIVPDIDGNYFAFIDREKKDSESNYYYEFMVVDNEANLTKPWGLGESQSSGLFSSFKKALSGLGNAPYFENISNKVTRCRSNDTKISIGLDGSYYFQYSSHIAKFDRSGKIIYMKEFSKGYIKHKLVGDKEGNAYYVLDRSDGSNKYELIKISPDGSNLTTFIKHVLDGGELCNESMLSISANGTIYCADYGGCIRIFDLDGKLQYASNKSLEKEAYVIKKKNEMED